MNRRAQWRNPDWVAPPGDAEVVDERAEQAQAWFGGLYGLPVTEFRFDGGVDFTLDRLPTDYAKLTVDVKWTPRLDGNMVVKNPRAKVFVLIRGYPFELVGWCWNNELERTNLGHNWCWFRRADQLRPNVDLLMALNGYPR